MNIENIRTARELLRAEINIKDTGTRNFSILIDSISYLDLLIKREHNPTKAKYIDKMINGK